MTTDALGSMDKLGDAFDAVAKIPSGPSIDTVASPLDRIVGKFDSLSTKDKPAESVSGVKMRQETQQMTDIMTSIGTQLQQNGDPGLITLANALGPNYFELQHSKRQLESLGTRNDKASRAQRVRVQQQFLANFRRFRDGYVSWRQTSYQDAKKKEAAQKKTRAEAAEKLDAVRKELRKLLDDRPDDEDLKRLVSSLGDIKKALLRGDLSKIELPDGGRFNPKKSSFTEYLEKWKSMIEVEKARVAEEEQEEESEEKEAAENIEEKTGQALRRVALTGARAARRAAETAITTPALVAGLGATAAGKALEKAVEKATSKTPGIKSDIAKAAKAKQEKELAAIDAEWDNVAKEVQAEPIAAEASSAALRVATEKETSLRSTIAQQQQRIDAITADLKQNAQLGERVEKAIASDEQEQQKRLTEVQSRQAVVQNLQQQLTTQNNPARQQALRAELVVAQTRVNEALANRYIADNSNLDAQLRIQARAKQLNTELEQIQQTLKAAQKELEKTTAAFELPEIKTEALSAIEDASAATTTAGAGGAVRVAGTASGARVTVGGAAAATAGGISMAPIVAAAAGAAVAATAAAGAASTASANAALQALGQQTAHLLNQIHTNTIPRAQGGLSIRPEVRADVQKKYASLTQGVQQALVQYPDNESLKNLQFFVGVRGPGIMEEGGALPESEEQDRRSFEHWKEDAGVTTEAIAPLLTREANTEDIDRGFEELLQQANARETGQPERNIAPQTRPQTPRARPNTNATSARGGTGAGGGSTGNRVPLGAQAPLGRALGLMAAQQAASRRPRAEIPALAGDTTLSSDELSPYRSDELEPAPLFPSYAVRAPAIGTPMAGEDTGEPLTTTEHERASALERQRQVETARQFVGAPTVAGDEGEGEFMTGEPTRETTLLEEETADEEEEGEGGEEGQAMDLETQKQESRLKNKAMDRAKQAAERRIKQLTEKIGKTAAKSGSTGVRAVLEGAEIATAEGIVPIVTLIIELNVQLLYKYFFKNIFKSTVKGSAVEQTGMKIGSILEQSFIEDIATVFVDVAVCTNVLLMPPMCFLTLPVVMVIGVVFAFLGMFGLDNAIGILSTLVK